MNDARHIFTATLGLIDVTIDGTPHRAKSVTVFTNASVNVDAGLIEPTGNPPKPYVSEIAWILINGAPQYKRNDAGQMIYVPTGQVVPEVAPSLKSRYKNVSELLNDIAAQNYTRQVKVDGTVLPFTQYGGEPPAFFGSEPGTGDLIEMEVPAIPPTIVVELPPNNTPGAPVVFEAANGDKNGRVFLTGGAGTPYVAHLTAKGMKDGYGHLSLSEVPGAATVARTREIALDGKIVEARGLPSVSSDVTFAVKAERFVSVNDVPRDAAVVEASWIGDQSAPFFVEYHAPQ